MKAEEIYIAKAIEHGRCTESGDFTMGNAAFDRMEAALAELRRHDDRGASVLIGLLTHSNGWVRLEAATHLLPLQPEVACEALKKLEAGPQSYIEHGAKMVLQEWRAGKLKVP
ncbi:hypothetical protein BH11PSE3_BH11PSE3_39320 [soil metagenome]